ncbi:succinyldiaminopimelate transaminase [Schauerella aestuarii]|uniref:succinyldiaminopimelate transaminase n=1 Tax=Schauerella aestuarii TaxID=2511204 RepID=UPI00136FAAC5|nr:succinyldiaminopimelate transaminase [Achromobacter aestuarii]MYZ41783.1 succinyldiaminopimelate transaminase [Achromobacter aestuarii]
MNPRLDALHPYPFERLRRLMAEAQTPNVALAPINLSIGEPKHAAPACVEAAITANLSGLSGYPPTKGDPRLREAIAAWLGWRYSIPTLDADTQVLPALGSREALFAFAQTVIDPNADSLVVCPNPFYQIYEGAALLAGATPYFLNADPARDFDCDWGSVPEAVWARTSLLFVCSPGNPAGNVMALESWRQIFELSDRHGFVIAADECYSEIYLDESNPPLGALQAARRLGRNDYRNLVSFGSLSKRSNVPGMRSGYVAGDANLIGKFLLYRTYHGSALSPVMSAASIAAWTDEAHVRDNRQLYREKFDAVVPILQPVLDVTRPQASFYLWARTKGSDTAFARDLFGQKAVTVLPGSFLAREAHGINPGEGRIRIALVAPIAQCVEAAHRIADFARSYA